jgi:pimeloyl-ACP methyl ester carboxylesterase
MPIHISKRIVNGIHGAELVVIPDAGHLCTIEQPEAVNKSMRSFLTRI